MAGPAANDSTQPVLPHEHGSPPARIVMWPTSPAALCRPRCSRPSRMIALPMPVPTTM